MSTLKSENRASIDDSWLQIFLKQRDIKVHLFTLVLLVVMNEYSYSRLTNTIGIVYCDKAIIDVIILTYNTTTPNQEMINKVL
jgi:hypothetical protein